MSLPLPPLYSPGAADHFFGGRCRSEVYAVATRFPKSAYAYSAICTLLMLASCCMLLISPVFVIAKVLSSQYLPTFPTPSIFSEATGASHYIDDIVLTGHGRCNAVGESIKRYCTDVAATEPEVDCTTIWIKNASMSLPENNIMISNDGGAVMSPQHSSATSRWTWPSWIVIQLYTLGGRLKSPLYKLGSLLEALHAPFVSATLYLIGCWTLFELARNIPDAYRIFRKQMEVNLAKSLKMEHIQKVQLEKVKVAMWRPHNEKLIMDMFGADCGGLISQFTYDNDCSTSLFDRYNAKYLNL